MPCDCISALNDFTWRVQSIHRDIVTTKKQRNEQVLALLKEEREYFENTECNCTDHWDAMTILKKGRDVCKVNNKTSTSLVLTFPVYINNKQDSYYFKITFRRSDPSPSKETNPA